MEKYPNKEDLERIRIMLPKGNGIRLAAKEAKCCENNVYNVLAQKYKSVDVINACLNVIEDDASKKLAFVDALKLKCYQKKMQRV